MSGIDLGRRSGPPARALPAAWAGLIGEYLIAEAGAGRSAATCVTRRAHLSRVARGLRGPPADVTEQQLVAWMGTNVHWSIETRRSYRNTAVSFFRWGHRGGHLPANPAADLPVMKSSVPAPRPAPDAAWRAALAAADARVVIMLRLAAEAGLRRAEVAQVHGRDLTVSPQGAQLLVHGKGQKLRVVPINDELAALISAGAAGHSPEMAAFGHHGWLFPGDDGGHLSPRWVGRLCSAALPDAWTMHTLRHRFATRAYRGSRNLRAVQVLLGHTSVATTQRYVGVDDDEVRAAMMSAL
ncbi:tyrosine-type recombinase/integrase [soil metagenome]